MAASSPSNAAQNVGNPPAKPVHTVSSFRNLIRKVQAPIREAALRPFQEPRLSISGVEIHPDNDVDKPSKRPNFLGPLKSLYYSTRSKLGLVKTKKTFVVMSGRCKLAIKAPSPQETIGREGDL